MSSCQDIANFKDLHTHRCTHSPLCEHTQTMHLRDHSAHLHSQVPGAQACTPPSLIPQMPLQTAVSFYGALTAASLYSPGPVPVKGPQKSLRRVF